MAYRTNGCRSNRFWKFFAFDVEFDCSIHTCVFSQFRTVKRFGRTVAYITTQRSRFMDRICALARVSRLVWMRLRRTVDSFERKKWKAEHVGSRLFSRYSNMIHSNHLMLSCSLRHCWCAAIATCKTFTYLCSSDCQSVESKEKKEQLNWSRQSEWIMCIFYSDYKLVVPIFHAFT